MDAAAAGWHGKLPTLGDFATRRLDASFVEPWDAWLSEGIATLRTQEKWLDAYLASPSWRFLLMPGVIGETAWVGVLMPSVDRVGRYYPLTLAHPLAALPRRADDVDTVWTWLLRIDEAAVDALQEDWDIDALEAELRRIGVPPLAAAAPSRATASLHAVPLQGHRHAAAAIAAQAAALGIDSLRGQAWWYAESGLESPVLLRSAGLDRGRLAARLFGTVGDNPATQLDAPR